MEKVFILFGSPGSGKSVACDILSKISRCDVVQKETTRPKRETDGSEIKNVKTISKNCDFRYSQYGYDYGFSSRDIWASLNENKSIVVIVNDIRTIKMLKRKFGNLAYTIYIHSNIDRAKIENISKKRCPDDDKFLLIDTEKRIEKIKTIHRKYIENTYLFDTSIINIFKEGKEPKELELQLKQIYNKEVFNKSSLGSTCRIIIIAAGSFAGKDDLVNAMIHIEPNKATAYQKGTTRSKKSGDNNELKHFNSERLPDSYDLIYEKNGGYQYGLSTKELWSELSQEKIVLIVLSDLESIKALKQKFNQICSVIYLHANTDKEELEKARKELSQEEFDKREKSIAELHEVYVNNMNIFDHVLLNTSESEDLYEQAFNILDHYLDGN